MSDGPHKSLNMSRSWKKVAERADNTAFDVDAVAEALPVALAQDCRAVPGSLILLLRELLDPARPQLFVDESILRLNDCRPASAGSPLALRFIESAIAVLNAGPVAADSLRDVFLQGFEANARQHGRQMEEHYLRKCRDPRRGPAVRSRLNDAVSKASYSSLADDLVARSRPVAKAPAKQSGLDDGVGI